MKNINDESTASWPSQELLGQRQRLHASLYRGDGRSVHGGHSRQIHLVGTQMQLEGIFKRFRFTPWRLAVVLLQGVAWGFADTEATSD